MGDIAVVDPTARAISVRRQTGVTSDFNAILGQVRENGSVVLVVSNGAENIFPPNPEELLLPVEIVGSLLEVSVRFDESANAVIITRGQPQAETVRDGAQHHFAEIYQVDYDYNLNQYGSFTNQNLTLNAAGRIADGRFSLMSNLSGASWHQLGFRNGSLIYERANGQRFIGGDLGTGTDLEFLSSNIRGALAQMPISGFTLTTFAGRAASGVFLPTFELPEENEFQQPKHIRSGLNYDTNVFGVYATTNNPAKNRLRPNPLTFSAGVMKFSGANRSGELLSGSMQYTQRRVRLLGDVAIGKFNGIGRDESRVKGFGAAVDFSGSLQLRDNLSVQGRFANIGSNFLSPQSGLHDPINLKAGGVSWQPKQWLSTSMSASTAAHPGKNGAQRDNSITATLGLTPHSTMLPTIFFSHTKSSSAQIENASFTLLNATKSFAGWRLFMNATRIKTLGPVSLNAQLGSNIRLNESNSLEVSQSIGSGGSLSGSTNWQTSNLFDRRLSLSAGFGYTKSSSSFSTSERVTASMRLPGQTALQVSYLQTNSGPVLMISLRGTLFRKHEAAAILNASTSEIKSYGAFSGRVYQDINLNGKFDVGIDKAQANAQVRVDGNRFVTTDASGLFRIDAVKVGEHKIYLDLLSVRADLTILDGAQQNAQLLSNRDSIVDFRLVRTGRITGIVWLDTNENGQMDENEQPLADVRVIAGSGRDTLTDENGYFVIGDLPPGEYVVLVDEKTLPEKMKSAPPLSIKVQAGSETGNMNFSIIEIPAEIKRFDAKPEE
ncbi:MAG: SdrD B-like domain-containing protein [Pyrinomonadaceae bacterium]